MPSSITHALIAKAALPLLPDAVRAAAEREPDYYLLGAQGPDLFFFYRPLSRKEYNLGKTLHRKNVYEWFSALLSALSGREGEERDKCLSYALGFCSHLSADAVFHPFVYAFLEHTAAPKKTHQIVENDWDVYFLREKEGKSAAGYRFPFSVKKIAREGVLFRYVRDAAASLGREVKKGAFKRMFRIFGWYLHHFHRAHFKYLRPLGFSYLYPRKKPTEGCLNGETFETLSGAKDADELFERAAEQSAERIGAFFEALGGKPLEKELFSRHMLTGESLG